MQIKDNLPTIKQESNLTSIQETNFSAELVKFKQAKQSSICNHAKPAEIVKVLQAGLFKLGIKNPPAVDEWAMYVKEITTYHGFLTIGEIELAFNMAIRQELNFDPETYQNFSLLYMNKMLAAYKQWAIKQHRELSSKSEEQKPIFIYKIEFTSIQKRQTELNEGYQDFINGVMTSPGFIPYEWFWWLLEFGVLTNLYGFQFISNKLYKDCEHAERKQLKEMQIVIWHYFERQKANNKLTIF